MDRGWCISKRTAELLVYDRSFSVWIYMHKIILRFLDLTLISGVGKGWHLVTYPNCSHYGQVTAESGDTGSGVSQ